MTAAVFLSIFGRMFRFLRRILEFIAGFIGIMLVLGLVAVWRLNSGPITSSFLTPYIETGIDNIIPDTQTTIAHTLLTWSNAEHSVRLHADGIIVKNKDGDVIAEVPDMDVELSAIGAAFGQLLPKQLLIDHPQIRLQRAPNGVIYFGGMTEHSSEPSDSKKALARVAHNLAHAYITHALQVKRAVFDVHDETSNRNWAVSIPDISLARENGNLVGQAKVEVTQKDETSTLDIHYNYDRASRLHVLQTQFEDITPSFFAGGHPDTLGLAQAAIFDLPLSGSIALSFDNDLNVDAALLDLHGDEGQLVYPTFWNDPRAVKNLDIQAEYDHARGKLNISKAIMDFGGPKLSVTVTGGKPLMAAHDLDFEMNVKMDGWPMDQFGQLWPKPVVPGARDWIIANMTKGKFDKGEATFKGNLSWGDLGNLSITEGKGRVQASNGRVQYLEGMPAVDGVSADATFDLTQMAIQITGGGIDDLRLKPFTIGLTGFQDEVQAIDIPIHIAGPIPNVLRLIDAPPLGYAKSVGLSPDDITGSLDGTVDLQFPLLVTLLMKDVQLKADASLTNVASSKLVKGIDITQGNLAFTLDKTGFGVKGPAQLNKLPVQATWRQNFDANAKPLMQASITGTISGDQWKMLGLDTMDGTRGPVPVVVQLSQNEKSTIMANGSMDMGNAEVKVDQLNWKKPSGAAAILKFTVEMPEGKDIAVKSLDLSGAQIKGKGDAILSPDGVHLLSLNMKPLILGRTNANVHFAQTMGEGGALRLDADGESLDISGIKGGNEPAHTDPRTKEFRIKVNKLFTSDTGLIAKAEGYATRDPQGWKEIKLHGLADGDQPIDIGLQPRNGGRVFSIACGDFGKALKGFGFTDTVTGGKLDIHGASSADTPNRIEGKARIGHFSVGKLPALAVLMNATSPFGLANLLSGTVEFDRLDGKFRWEGDDIELVEVRAAGTAVGINIDGKVNEETGNANLYGTIVPFSMVNRMLNWIPLLGDMLTGGEGGGVLAVAYTITGSLGEPRVSVNPVSLLTPGFLRNLFFGGGDDSSDDESDDATPVIPVKPAPVPTKSNINRGR